jgi:hypothetical protein
MSKNERAEIVRLTKKQKYLIGLNYLNMSQAALGRELGFCRSHISMLINGTRKNELFDKWMKENVLVLFTNKRSVK